MLADKTHDNAFGLYKPPVTNLGVLNLLPLELLQEVLSQVDVYTFLIFRLVNRQANGTVESVPAYRAIIKYAWNAVRGILAIGTGRWITVNTLYEKLCTAECEQCGYFGGYLYLLTCKRVCFVCVSRNTLYLPLRPSDASRRFGLSRELVKTLPCMRAVPGTYAPHGGEVPNSLLVDTESALRTGITTHGSVEAMGQFISEAYRPRIYNTRAAAAERLRSAAPRPIPFTTDYPQRWAENANRFVAIARVPCLDAKSQQVEWGFHCIGCKKSRFKVRHYRRKYTTASFRDHLEQFGDIKDERHSRISTLSNLL
ncbi:hypothetical protein F5Y03DRAFT_381570 [Xylaria venustula]|nr:hypothetical protein F5Y03DRAFT_381570 [Xylaria venustula]